MIGARLGALTCSCHVRWQGSLRMLLGLNKYLVWAITAAVVQFARRCTVLVSSEVQLARTVHHPLPPSTVWRCNMHAVFQTGRSSPPHAHRTILASAHPPPTAPHQLAGLGMANGCRNHGYHLLEWRLAQGVAEGCGQGDGGQGGVSARRCHGCASVLWCRRTPRSSCGIPLRRCFRSAFIEFRRARGCGRVLESSHVFCS